MSLHPMNSTPLILRTVAMISSPLVHMLKPALLLHGFSPLLLLYCNYSPLYCLHMALSLYTGSLRFMLACHTFANHVHLHLFPPFPSHFSSHSSLAMLSFLCTLYCLHLSLNQAYLFFNVFLDTGIPYPFAMCCHAYPVACS
jgi:hypothetical protein